MVPRVNDKPWKRKQWKDVVAVDVKYEDKAKTCPKICIWRRTLAGKSMVMDPDPFPSYFYIPKQDEGLIETMGPGLSPDSIEYPASRTLDKMEVVKLVYNKFDKNQFKAARDHFPTTYEDDVKYLWRYLLDNDIKYTTDRRICYIDIETEMSVDIKDTPVPVISVTIYDSKSEMMGTLLLDRTLSNLTITEKIDEHNFIIRFKSERALLEAFVKYIQIYDPDIITAYNLINFDFPYLINRMRKLDVSTKAMSQTGSCYAIIDEKNEYDPKCYCGGRELMDWYILMKKLYDEDKPDDFKLDTVGEKILGMKKTEHPYKNLMELYQKDVKLFVEYNRQDVLILVKLEEKIGFISKYMLSLQQLIPMPMEQLKSNSLAWDFRILLKYNGKIIFPSKRKREHHRFTGALTGKFVEKNGKIHSVNPEKKMFSNIGVLDFSGMYPNIFRTLNISPETLCIPGEPNSVAVEGNAFTQDFIGIMPQLVQEIMDLRNVYTEKLNQVDPNSQEYVLYYNLQYGVKRLNNSLYGATGYSGFRLFDLRVAETITKFGQFLISAVFRFLRDGMGYDTIYQDTDSVFIPLKCELNDRQAVEAEIEKIEKEVNEMIEKLVLSKGASNNYMKMDFEKRFTKVIFLGVKKRYLGKADLWKGKWLDKPKFVIKGYDIARRELPKVTRDILKNVLDKFLDDYSTADIKVFYQSQIKDLKNRPLWEIAITRRLGKDTAQYVKTLPQHIKAALVGEQNFGVKFQKGDQIKIMYVSDVPFVNNKGISVRSDVIGFYKDTKLPPKIISRIDYKRYIEACIKHKLEMFYGTVGMNMEEVLSEHASFASFNQCHNAIAIVTHGINRVGVKTGDTI